MINKISFKALRDFNETIRSDAIEGYRAAFLLFLNEKVECNCECCKSDGHKEDCEMCEGTARIPRYKLYEVKEKNDSN